MRYIETAYFLCIWLIGGASLVIADDAVLADALKRLPAGLRQKLFKPVEELHVRDAIRGTSPDDFADDLFQSTTPAPAVRTETATEFQWEASNVFHKPAYFEHVPLERYGQTGSRNWQPVFSGVRFFGNAAALPWKAITECPCEDVTTLGLFRPGSPTPCIRQRLLK